MATSITSRDPIVVKSGSGTTTPAAGSADKITVGKFTIDPSFLDALYVGGKLNGAQRDAILAGADPRGFSLSNYDLYYLTAGQFGSKDSSVLQIGSIEAYNAAKAYLPGDVLTYAPTGAQVSGLFQCIKASTGNLPTVATFFNQITAPGPVVLVDIEILNPQIAQSGAAIAATSTCTRTAGTALPAVTIPGGKGYCVTAETVTPVAAGGLTPADCHLDVVFHCVEGAPGGDGSRTLTVTPIWRGTTLLNTQSAAVTVNTMKSRVKISLK